MVRNKAHHFPPGAMYLQSLQILDVKAIRLRGCQGCKIIAPHELLVGTLGAAREYFHLFWTAPLISNERKIANRLTHGCKWFQHFSQKD